MPTRNNPGWLRFAGAPPLELSKHMIRRKDLPTGLELDRRLKSHESGVLNLRTRLTQPGGDRFQLNIIHHVFEFDTLAILALVETEAEKLKAELTKLGVHVW